MPQNKHLLYVWFIVFRCAGNWNKYHCSGATKYSIVKWGVSNEKKKTFHRNGWISSIVEYEYTPKNFICPFFGLLFVHFATKMITYSSFVLNKHKYLHYSLFLLWNLFQPSSLSAFRRAEKWNPRTNWKVNFVEKQMFHQASVLSALSNLPAVDFQRVHAPRLETKTKTNQKWIQNKLIITVKSGVEICVHSLLQFVPFFAIDFN